MKNVTGIFVFGILLLSMVACNSAYESTYPAWVKDAVFYQIFPERFHSAQSENDPTKESLKGAWPHDSVEHWNVHPWTSDWYKLQPWEEKNGRGFFYNDQLRRYGGDIAGIIEKLDYLNKLGITAIYLNPVFQSPSLHKYDATLYRHIDPFFGPDPQGDLSIMRTENPTDPDTWKWTSADKMFLDLLEKAHQRNIKIIIDGVFNHVGMTFWAFEDVKRNGPRSPYKDWFTVLSWDDPQTAENEFDYAGWVGVKELPELREDDNGLIPPIRQHIFNITERWMDPNKDGNPEDGIDGWRLDVAEMVHHDFWIQFRNKVKAINPQAYITGEIFWDDWQNNKMMDPEPWLRGDQFDGVMNYRWAQAVTHFFIDKELKISASEFAAKLHQLDESYTTNTRYLLLNLMDSHDTDRLASNIVNPDLLYDKRVGARDNNNYNVRKPKQRELQIQKLIALFQFTVPGPPMIYYGTEAGMWGGDDPDCRKPMVWPEFDYEDEVVNVSNIPRPTDTVEFNKDLFAYYKKLIHLRKKESVLRRGDMQFLLTDDNKDVLGFSRQLKNEQIIILINNSWENQSIDIPVGGPRWENLWDGEMVTASDGRLQIEMEKKSGLILMRN